MARWVSRPPRDAIPVTGQSVVKLRLAHRRLLQPPGQCYMPCLRKLRCQRSSAWMLLILGLLDRDDNFQEAQTSTMIGPL